jgi:chromosome segregation ATPase
MSKEIIQQLDKLADAMSLTGASAAQSIIVAASRGLSDAMERTERAVNAEEIAHSQYLDAKHAMEKLENELREYKSRDLGPEVRKLKETVAALDDAGIQYRREIEDLRAFRGEQQVEINRLNEQVDSLRRAKSGVEQFVRWGQQAMEVLKLGVEKKIDPDDAMRIAGYLATGNEVPVGAVDSLSLRAAMDGVKNMKGGEFISKRETVPRVPKG